MNVTRVFIAACIWQSGDFDPLVRKDDKGLWTFLSERFDLEKSENLARQTLERGLRQLVNGTLNPMLANKPGFAGKFALANERACVVATDEAATRVMSNPLSHTRAHVYVVLPMFWTGEAQSEPLAGTDFVTRVYSRKEAFHPVVERVLSLNMNAWSRYEKGKSFIPMRPNFGRIGGTLRKMNVAEDIVTKLTDPYSEDYWEPSQQSLEHVA